MGVSFTLSFRYTSALRVLMIIIVIPFTEHVTLSMGHLSISSVPDR